MENVRTYSIHALLVIGGFEVRGHHGSKRGGGDPRASLLCLGPPRQPFGNLIHREVSAGHSDDGAAQTVVWCGEVFAL